MNEIPRPSPRGKRVSLFATCIIDHIYPQTGIAVVEILERLGIEIDYPLGQTCCGQPGFNSGHWEDARSVARQFLKAFAAAEVIVTPSGSCASMIRHYYPVLFEEDERWLQRAEQAAQITWEFSEYLVDGLGISDLGARLPATEVAFHDACHGLRLMGLQGQLRQLAAKIEGVSLCELEDADQCCGFGGLFAVKMSEISVAMADGKAEHIVASEVDRVLTGDCGCLTQLNGRLSRRGEPPIVQHIAELLAEGIRYAEANPNTSQDQ
ncbi:MAG: (Fe-S)-binding protein [Anaerolineaceae bacterium]|nr:(Fe-S)-binding protein [Anaerolineaceae bacterium]